MFFRRRFGYGYPYAGASFARFLSFLCPMLLFGLALARTFPFSPSLLRVLYTGLMILLPMTGAVALTLLWMGPWQNRFAGVWLLLVASTVFYFTDTVVAWAAYLDRMI